MFADFVVSLAAFIALIIGVIILMFVVGGMKMPKPVTKTVVPAAKTTAPTTKTAAPAQPEVKPSFKKEHFENELNFMYTGIDDQLAN